MVIPTSFFRSETSERLRDEGRVEGAAVQAAQDILRLLDIRGLEVSAVVRDRIAGCADLELLDRWFRLAVVAGRAGELFAED